MSFCPKCGEKLETKNACPEAWGVCPKCQWTGYIILANLENSNIPIAQAIRDVQNGTSVPGNPNLGLLKAIAAAEYAQSSIGNLGSWSHSKFLGIGFALGDVIPQRWNPAFIDVNKTFLERTSDFSFCASTKVIDAGIISGINIPMFQKQNQYIGHNVLLQKRPQDYSGFAWRTFLHRFYSNTDRGFLCYRPGTWDKNTEILLVDNFTAFVQMVYWYDTSLQDPSRVFRGDVIPVMVLGKRDIALDYLFDYHWSPSRITVVSPFRELSDAVEERMKQNRTLGCKCMRSVQGIYRLGLTLKMCRSRGNFEDLILKSFIERNYYETRERRTEKSKNDSKVSRGGYTDCPVGMRRTDDRLDNKYWQCARDGGGTR